MVLDENVKALLVVTVMMVLIMAIIVVPMTMAY